MEDSRNTITTTRMMRTKQMDGRIQSIKRNQYFAANVGEDDLADDGASNT